ncbi:MAG: transposase [Gammaproteobacteria bacterium]|nr:transposase [Gammaproteobacteria bacterium]
MSRPLRIIYKNAWYHVMNRGANRRRIFYTDAQRNMFVSLLRELVVYYDAEIHAYCLMNNHYHILINTPRGNLPRMMRHLGGVYTQRFNKSMRADGPLFRGRYKAILVEEDAYLLQVSRYIHLNPVAAKMVNNPEEFRWSSFLAYIQSDCKPAWLQTSKILGQIASADSINAYKNFVDCGVDKETVNFYNKKKVAAVFGREAFRGKILAEVDESQITHSKADLKAISAIPPIEFIFKIVSDYYKVNVGRLCFSKRGCENLPRNMAVVVCRTLYDYELQIVADAVSNIKPYSVSTITRRMLGSIASSKQLSVDYDNICRMICCKLSQVKT